MKLANILKPNKAKHALSNMDRPPISYILSINMWKKSAKPREKFKKAKNTFKYTNS
jgi:hypothetical protein